MVRVSPVDICPFCDEAPCQCRELAKAATKKRQKIKKPAAPSVPVTSPTVGRQAEPTGPIERPLADTTAAAIDTPTDDDDPPEPTFSDIQRDEEDRLMASAIKCFVDAGMVTPESPEQKAVRWRAEMWRDKLNGFLA